MPLNRAGLAFVNMTQKSRPTHNQRTPDKRAQDKRAQDKRAQDKRSMAIHGHRTSIALETEFWRVIDQAVEEDGRSLAAFVTALDDMRIKSNSPHGLAAYLRLYALKFVQTRDD